MHARPHSLAVVRKSAITTTTASTVSGRTARTVWACIAWRTPSFSAVRCANETGARVPNRWDPPSCDRPPVAHVRASLRTNWPYLDGQSRYFQNVVELGEHDVVSMCPAFTKFVQVGQVGDLLLERGAYLLQFCNPPQGNSGPLSRGWHMDGTYTIRVRRRRLLVGFSPGSSACPHLPPLPQFVLRFHVKL